MEQEKRQILFTVAVFEGAQFKRTFILNAYVSKEQAEILNSKDGRSAKVRSEIQAHIADAFSLNHGFTAEKGYYVRIDPYELVSVDISELGK